ncbi:hypothetical protein [Marinobacter sp.]|uniref:hypothetical protein n=1 Tax=Marinobacter sp. TaxID=50741 RepID=UPI003A8F4706
MITKDDLYPLVNGFERLPRQINELSEGSFEKVYGSAEASKAKGIIYFFLSSMPVPRLHGESRILYIGQTKNDFRSRYLRHAKLHATSKANSLKFGAILREYGPIEVAVCDYRRFGETLIKAEGQFLWWYFQNHCEYPPINYTRTNVRTDAVDA